MTSSDQPLRIPVKPQTWLFALNLVIQAPMAALFFYMAYSAEAGELWLQLFGGVMGLICLGLFGFSALVLARTLGKELVLVLEEDTLTVPNAVTGKVDRVALTKVTKAQIIETKTVAVSFWSLSLHYTDAGGQERAVAIQSQIIGVPAFGALSEALRDRGVRIIE